MFESNAAIMTVTLPRSSRCITNTGSQPNPERSRAVQSQLHQTNPHDSSGERGVLEPSKSRVVEVATDD